MENEELIIGNILSRGNKEVALYALRMLKPEVFTDGRRRRIFIALREGVMKGKEVDFPVIAEQADVSVSYLAELAEGGIGPVRISKQVVDEVYADWVSKRFRSVYKGAAKRLDSEEPAEVASWVDDKLAAVRDTAVNRDIEAKYRERKKLFRERIRETGVLGLSTGYPKLDMAVGGIQGGQVWVVGGYEGIGKSFLAQNIVRNMILAGHRIAFFSTENSAMFNIERLVCISAGVSYAEVCNPGSLSKEQREAVALAEAEVFEAIDDGVFCLYDDRHTASEIALTARSLMLDRQLDLVVVDWVQNLLGHSDRYERNAQNAFALQELAQTTNSCVMLMSQISEKAHRDGPGSRGLGFKNAGEYGQVADIGIRLYREHADDGVSYLDELSLFIKKNRSGTPGRLDLQMVFPGGRIKSIAPEEAEV